MAESTTKSPCPARTAVISQADPDNRLIAQLLDELNNAAQRPIDGD
jgi:hypothetical protein